MGASAVDGVTDEECDVSDAKDVLAPFAPKPRVFPALARQAERERLRKAAEEYDATAQALEEEGQLRDARVKRKQASDCRLKIRLMR